MTRALLSLVIVMSAACSDDSKGSLDAQRSDLSPVLDRQAAPDQAVDLRSAGPEARAPDRRAADRGPLDARKGDVFGLGCGSPVGSGTVSGTVKGRVLSAASAGGVKLDAAGLVGYGVGLMAAASGTCSSIAQLAQPPVVWITLCSNLPGTYSVGKNCRDGSGISIVNSITLPDPSGTDPKATSGTITIDAFDPACGGMVKGAFSVDFAGELVKGTFDTVGCGVLAR